MRVFLINPSSAPGAAAGVYSGSMFPMPPLGLAYLAGVARDLGCETAVEDQYASRLDAEQVAALAARRRADVVGVSCLSSSMPEAETIVNIVRARLPDAHITLGNIHATLFAGELLGRLPVDSVVLGEGEETFAELLNCLGRGDSVESIPGLACVGAADAGTARPRPPIEDLDALPRPAWEFFRLDDYLAPPRLMFRDRVLAVHAARGCPWNCSFCSQNFFMPGLRRRGMGGLVEELEWMLDELGISCFGFQDAAFPLTEEEGFEFCRAMAGRGLHEKMRWFTETRPDLVSFDLLKEMKRCGCLFVMYGFESASARHLDAAGKNLDPDRAYEVMDYMKRLKMPAYGLFMVGFPDETVEEARATIGYARRLDCEIASFARVTPYPGTALYDEYKDSFPPGVSVRQWNNQYRPRPGETMWQLPGLSHEQITALIREAMLGYYLRPRMILRHLRLGFFSFADILRGASYLIRELLAKLPLSFSFRRRSVRA